MAVTLTNSQTSAGLYSAFWNRAPDATGQNFWVNKLNTGAITPLEMATAAYNAPEGFAAYPSWIRNDKTALITEVYQSVFNRDPDAGGLAFWTAKLTTDALGNVTNFPQVVLNMMNAAIQSAAAGNTDGMQFLNEIQVGIFVSETLRTDDPAITSVAFQGVSYDEASVVIREAQLAEMVHGQTFTLTTGIDVFTATTDNATFNAVADAGAANTMNSGDVLTGAGGVNTLNILGTGTTGGLVETNNIENVAVRAVANTQFSQVLMNDVASVSSNNSLGTLTVTAADLNSEYSLNNTVNTGANNATMTVTYTTLTGTADTAKLAVNNAGSATVVQTIDVRNTNTIDAVTLRTHGTNNVILTAGTAADAFTVSGDGTNTINVATAAAAGLGFDASETTGANTLSFAAGLVKSSSTIVGGSGADTLTVTSIADLNYATPTLSGIETLTINQGQTALAAATTFTIGLGRTTGLTDINLVAAAANNNATTVLSQLGAGVDINMTALAANAAGANDFNAVTILGSFAGVADQQTINVDSTADLIDSAGLLTTTGLETLNYVVTGDADNFAATLGGLTSTSRLSALTVSTEGFTVGTEVNVALGTVTATGATLDVVDFQGADTGVSVAFAAASLNDDAVVLGGSGNDTINAASVSLSASTASITVVGGLGADTMTAIGNTANDGSTVFAIAQGDSGITVATADSILGWDDTDNSGDYLALGVAGDDTADTGNFVSADGALTFAQALADANTALTTLAATTLSSQIYSLQVDTGADIGYLFTDYNLDGTADQVVLIQTIATAGGFSFDHIIA